MITVLDIETTMDFENSTSSPYNGQQIVFVGYRSFTSDLSTIETNELFLSLKKFSEDPKLFVDLCQVKSDLIKYSISSLLMFWK